MRKELFLNQSMKVNVYKWIISSCNWIYTLDSQKTYSFGSTYCNDKKWWSMCVLFSDLSHGTGDGNLRDG